MELQREFAALIRQVLTLAALLAGTGVIAAVLIALSERDSLAMKLAGREFANSAVTSVAAVILALTGLIFSSSGLVGFLPYMATVFLLAGVAAVVTVLIASVQMLRATLSIANFAYGPGATWASRTAIAGVGVATIVLVVLVVLLRVPF